MLQVMVGINYNEVNTALLNSVQVSDDLQEICLSVGVCWSQFSKSGGSCTLGET